MKYIKILDLFYGTGGSNESGRMPDPEKGRLLNNIRPKGYMKKAFTVENK